MATRTAPINCSRVLESMKYTTLTQPMPRLGYEKTFFQQLLTTNGKRFVGVLLCCAIVVLWYCVVCYGIINTRIHYWLN